MILTHNYLLAKQKDKISCQCDYCGKYFTRLKHNIDRSHKNIGKDSCSDKVCVQKKRIEVNKLLFGTDNSFQNQVIKQKIKDTNIEKYGVENPMQRKEVCDKYIQTCIQKHGVKNVFQNQAIKDKIKTTILEKYGVKNPMQSKEIRDKQKERLKEKYGVSHALQNNEIRQKSIETCIKNHGKFPVNNYGKTQQEIQNWLNSMGFNFASSRSLIPGSEIDLYDAQKGLGIEFCGLYWHNEHSPEPRTRLYHFDKYKKCLDQGIRLITIFSDEWENRQKQCQGHIKSILGINEKRIFARKCDIREIFKKEGCLFFEENHIQGGNRLGIVFFGLFFSGELVGVMSLGMHHRGGGKLVLDRLCFKNGIQVTGGASKLFHSCKLWALSRGFSKIISFSDNRWTNGDIYKVLGFSLEKEYGPDYSYVNKNKAVVRLSKQSQKKSSVNCPLGVTELEWANERDLSRIWDCGKKRWVFVV